MPSAALRANGEMMQLPLAGTPEERKKHGINIKKSPRRKRGSGEDPASSLKNLILRSLG